MSTINIIFLTLFIILIPSGCSKKGNVDITSTDDGRNNNVHLKEVIIEETFMKMYPEGASEFFKNIVRQQVDKEEEAITRKLEEAIRVWNSPNMNSEEYYESAMVIVQHMELSKGQFLTFGNIFEVLGPPAKVEEREYVFEIDNNISPFMTRIEIQYKHEKVKLLFTITGFLDSIIFYKESPLRNVWTGIAPIHWPQGYEYSKELPIISGKFNNLQSSQNLLNNVEKMLSNYSEVNWLGFMLYSEPLKETEKVNKKTDSKVTIILVDGITEGLAKVYLKIVNTQKLYCDTWWSQVDGKWQIISLKQAEQIIEEEFETQKKKILSEN